MPALSFTEEWLNKLLSGDKQQTTRPQTTRIWIGDPIVNIYNQQRRRIADKPLRRLTKDGVRVMTQKTVEGTYPYPPEWHTNMSYAHFLGKVKITEVYDIIPSTMTGNELEVWAMKDGFDCYGDAYTWFESRYDDNWMEDTFTVIRWKGWLERYFEPEEV